METLAYMTYFNAGINTLLIVGIYIYGFVLPERAKSRIRKHGGQILSVRLKDVAKLLFIPVEIVYVIHYLDGDGNEHEAFVRPNVYFSAEIVEDKVIKHV